MEWRQNVLTMVTLKKVVRKTILIFAPILIPHSGTLAWRIPWTEEPNVLQSMGLQSQAQLSGLAHGV